MMGKKEKLAIGSLGYLGTPSDSKLEWYGPAPIGTGTVAPNWAYNTTDSTIYGNSPKGGVTYTSRNLGM